MSVSFTGNPLAKAGGVGLLAIAAHALGATVATAAAVVASPVVIGAAAVGGAAYVAKKIYDNSQEEKK